MALTGIEIFKLLPKTNCKKCGFPTCLAFAMKVAQGQAKIEDCPEASEEIKSKLRDAATPPIIEVQFGTDSMKLKIGGQNVLFRHEKKFLNPTVLALEVADDDSEIETRIDEVLNSSIERVGETLRIEAIYLKNRSADISKYRDALERILKKAPQIPLILGVSSSDIAIDSLSILKGHRPILHGATAENIEEMAKVAAKFNVPLVVSAKGVEAVIPLTEKAKALGVGDLIINAEPKSIGELLRDNTFIARGALKKQIRSVGYPIITFAWGKDDFYETIVSTVGILKYSSILVLKRTLPWKNLALFTIRQNIYSDPQVPMQVKQGIYRVGEPDDKSPFIVTTNFALTYFLVKGEIENSKIPVWLGIMDCDGLSVLTAWAAGKFSASKIAQFVKESGIEEKLNHRELIIPGYVAMLKASIEDKLSGWKVVIGTKEASGIPAFLRNYVRSKNDR